jgi:hypothetical protein
LQLEEAEMFALAEEASRRRKMMVYFDMSTDMS